MASLSVTVFFLSSSAIVSPTDFLIDLPLPCLRFRFGRLGSTLTRVAFFAMNLPVRDRGEVWTIQ
jgi:hypothetical protein